MKTRWDKPPEPPKPAHNKPLTADTDIFSQLARERIEAEEEHAISVEQAVAELLRRQRSQESLAEYARSVEIPGAPLSADPENEQFRPVETSLAAHHLLFCQKIQECIEKDHGRLMIFAPPGSAKSSYASVVAVCWAMAKFQNFRIILASYATNIAEKQSRRARALCRQEAHVSIWPDRPELQTDQRAVGSWALSNGNEFMAAGLLAGITGNRADLAIVDDPVSGREDADSPTIQKKTIDAYRDDIVSRLKPKASVIIIQTRWNENDLSGSILPEDYKGQSGQIACRDGQTWEVINLPAEAENPDDPLGRKPGEFLWLDWFGMEHWNIRKNDPQGQRTWASLYQQRPTAGDGIEFKREWFKWYDPDASPGSPGGLPKNLTLYGASDYATKQDKGDFTEHAVWGIDDVGDLWAIDWWYGQKTTDITIAQKINMIRKHRQANASFGHIIKWWHEGGPIGSAITPAINKAMREGKVYVTLEELTSIQNKAIKLASFQARAATGTVHFPNGRPWAGRVVDQLCGFPAARYDDAADVCGLIGRGIDAMANPHIPSAKPKPSLVPFSVAWLTYQEKDERNKPRYF
jgi:predicted phage terminase large subunit-like protein